MLTPMTSPEAAVPPNSPKQVQGVVGEILQCGAGRAELIRELQYRPAQRGDDLVPGVDQRDGDASLTCVERKGGATPA